VSKHLSDRPLAVERRAVMDGQLRPPTDQSEEPY
jgi:hypothetical protein